MSTEITVMKPFGDLETEVYEALNMVQSGVGTPEQWLVDALGGGSTSASGARVNYDTVLGIPAANRSINMIAGHIAAMPKQVRRRLSTGGNEIIWEHPASVVTNLYCNDRQTCFTMWQTMMSHTLLLGNSRAFIRRDGNGMPAELAPLMPNATYTIVINGAKYHVTYFTSDQFNDILSPTLAAALEPYEHSNSVSGGNGYQYTIPDAEVFHIPGIGYNGMWGYPLTILAKDTFGVELSGLDAVSYQFNNGGRPGLLLTAPKGLFRTEKEAMEFMNQFTKTHEGTKNAGRTGMLREGMTASTIEAASADGGLKELRDASEDDIALLFGTEYMLGESSAVYKDLPDRFTAYVTNTLNQWMETIEQEGGRKLLTTNQVRRGIHLHLEPRALLRGSPNSVADLSGKLRTQGAISGNEVREMQGMNPVPELADDYGNPNVQSGSPEDEDLPEEEETADDQEEAQAKYAAALAYNFRSLIEFEMKKVRELTRKEKPAQDRIVSISKFYDTYYSQLAKTCSDLGIDESKAQKHVDISKLRIIDLLGATSPGDIPVAVAELVTDWRTRSGEFAK